MFSAIAVPPFLQHDEAGGDGADADDGGAVVDILAVEPHHAGGAAVQVGGVHRAEAGKHAILDELCRLAVAWFR